MSCAASGRERSSRTAVLILLVARRDDFGLPATSRPAS
jgi:hypothetical protein